MHRYYFARLGLLEEASDPAAGGAASAGAPPAAAKAPEAAPPPATAPPAPLAKASVIDRAVNLFKDKGELTSEIASLKQSTGTLTAEVARLKTELAAVTTERDGLKAEFAKLETALAESEKKQTTVQQEVVHQLATAFVPEAKLPAGAPAAAAAGSLDEQIADINARAEKATDPKERGRLANQAWDLMKQRAKAARSPHGAN